MFIFLDESGDLGSDLTKNGTSKRFTITILVCDELSIVKEINKAIKITLARKINSKNKNSKKELKGSLTKFEIKEYLSGRLPDNGWKIYSVTLDKENMASILTTKQGKNKVYNHLSRLVLEKVDFTKVTNSNIHFVVDKCKNKTEMEIFNTYILKHLSSLLPTNSQLSINHQSSVEEYCLQAVDLFCWGIARKYDGNNRWYEIFKENIVYDELYNGKG